MSKSEIIAELAHLSPEELADVKAWIDQRADRDGSASQKRGAREAYVRSPRLANPAQASDFRKQVTELSADAGV
jgi:hypothetical protein